MDYPEVLQLACCSDQSDKSAFLALMVPQLTKPTYKTCWAYSTLILLWKKNFTDKKSLQFLFLRITFTTLTFQMFKLINLEERLNAKLPEGTDRRIGRTERETIHNIYQDPTFLDRFANVDRKIFQWEAKTAKRQNAVTSPPSG